MRPLAHHTIASLALLAAMLPAAAKTAGLEPLQVFQMVRSLQIVQDRLASGDHAALPMQRKLLELIDKRLRETGQDGYGDPRNFQALMVYAMSGGNPETIGTALSRLALDEGDRKIGNGILAYLKGDFANARTTLATVDAHSVPHEVSAFLALVKGSVNAAEQPAEALKLFDHARLLGPGTLVEEAALRRSVDLAATIGDAPRFMLASTQYVTRYLRSPYASQFADSFVSGVISLHASIDLERIDDVTAMMDADQEQAIYLRIARRAAIEGFSELSTFAAGKAQRLPDSSGDDPRALLYSSLSSVTTGTAEEIRARLARIDRTRLSQGDRQLFDAVAAVADKLTAALPVLPQPAMAMPQMAAPEPTSAVEQASDADPAPATQADALVAETRRKLDAIDKLLEGELR
ncbi:MAG: chemotaxis protein MotC [Pseudaminobacter sp.]